MLSGRGFGKTRSGAEWVRDQIESHGKENIALVGPTAADVRDVMVEGESGILAVSPPWAKPKYEPSLRKVTWPNGAEAHCYSAEEPDRLRGPNHDAAWADELASWQYLDEAWDNLEFGLRTGADPRAVVTTTPKPKAKLRDILKDQDTVQTRGSTFDNAANLAPKALARLIRKYEGTRTGRQELYAELLEEAEGALWKREWFDLPGIRLNAAPALAEFKRLVVAIDPAVTANEQSDETGIITAGLLRNGHGCVLADLSGRMSPDAWAKKAVGAFDFYEADRIVAEVNNGGDMVAGTVRSVRPNISFRAVRASKGKAARAEPVSALYEQQRVHHVGAFPQLEDQLCNWEPLSDDKSPDRLDALVWALTDLMLDNAQGIIAKPVVLTRERAWPT